MADHLVDEIPGSASVPLPPLLVAPDHVDPKGERRFPALRDSERGLGDRGALTMLPLLALAGSEAHRGDDGVSLGLEPAQGFVFVELPVEVETTNLDARSAGFRE
jgi:hypothetical protein